MILVVTAWEIVVPDVVIVVYILMPKQDAQCYVIQRHAKMIVMLAVVVKDVVEIVKIIVVMVLVLAVVCGVVPDWPPQLFFILRLTLL